MRPLPILSGLVAAMGLLVAAGCGAPSRDQVFADVAETVHERTGHLVPCHQGAAEDAEVEAAVRALLATELTPDLAVQVALLANPGLHATYQELGVSQAELVQAGLLRNPNLAAGVKFFTEGPKAEMSLVEDLLQVFTLPAHERLAEVHLAEAKARVAGAVIDLIGTVRRASYRYQAAMQAVELRRGALQALAASADLARRSRDAGEGTELQLAGAQAANEQARLDVAVAEEELTVARERLNALMGLWGADSARWRMAGHLPELPESDGTGDGTGLEHAAILASLDLAIQRERMRNVGERYGIERLDSWVGDVEAGAVAEREPGGAWGFGPQLGFSLPIFDQGQGVRAAANAELEMAARCYRATAVEVRARVRAARAQVRAQHARARFIAHVLLPLRDRVLEQSSLHADDTPVGPAQVLAARRERVDAGGQYLDALQRYWIDRADLDQLLVGRIPAADDGRTSDSKK